MRFGLILPSFSFPDLDYAKAAGLREFAVRAEALGYEALWVVEHLLTARGLYGTAWLSPLETLSFAAGCTSHIRLATGILIAALRNPVFVAKDIASLQYLSGGRFELGLGVGWDAHEYEVAGVPLRQRGGRTDEMLGMFERLWTGEPVPHHGRFTSSRMSSSTHRYRNSRFCGLRAVPRPRPICRPIRRSWRQPFWSGSADMPMAGWRAPPARWRASSPIGRRSKSGSTRSAGRATASRSDTSISCISCRPTTRRRRCACSGRSSSGSWARTALSRRCAPATSSAPRRRSAPGSRRCKMPG